MNNEKRQGIFQEIDAERNRQDAKFGEQNRTLCQWIAILMEEVGEAGKEGLDTELFGSDRLEQFREEMVQVAAVAVHIIEATDRPHFKELHRREGDK